jgi:hypothetical protein
VIGQERNKMPFKTKPTRVVGVNGWEVEVPTPPKHATHARITCFNQTYENGSPKKATVPIKDFGVLKGVEGEFQYIRMNKQLKVLEEYDGVWEWDGRKVVGIEEMREQ